MRSDPGAVGPVGPVPIGLGRRIPDHLVGGLVLAGGRIVRTGGPELALELEEEGYEAVAA